MLGSLNGIKSKYSIFIHSSHELKQHGASSTVKECLVKRNNFPDITYELKAAPVCKYSFIKSHSHLPNCNAVAALQNPLEDSVRLPMEMCAHDCLLLALRLLCCLVTEGRDCKRTGLD